MVYDAVFGGRDKSQKIKVETILIAMVEHVNTVDGLMQGVTAQNLARNAKNVGKITTSKPCAEVVMGTQIDVTHVGPDPKRARVIMGKNSMRLLKTRAII